MLTLLFASMLAAAPVQAHAPDWTGTWRNASNSVHIRAARCGLEMCGTVVWANDRAKADAARGGTRELIGTQIFRRFRAEGGQWAGEVYVPDIDQTIAGTIRLDGRDTLVGEACLFGRIGCREQRWTRVQ
ncbi:DUF2147 domain-containing protein [Sphingomonas sp.]